MPYSPVSNASERKTKRQPLTIREKVKNKYPDFDESKHRVFVNNEPIERSQLDRAVSFIDIVSIKPV